MKTNYIQGSSTKLQDRSGNPLVIDGKAIRVSDLLDTLRDEYSEGFTVQQASDPIWQKYGIRFSTHLASRLYDLGLLQRERLKEKSTYFLYHTSSNPEEAKSQHRGIDPKSMTSANSPIKNIFGYEIISHFGNPITANDLTQRLTAESAEGFTTREGSRYLSDAYDVSGKGGEIFDALANLKLLERIQTQNPSVGLHHNIYIPLLPSAEVTPLEAEERHVQLLSELNHRPELEHGSLFRLLGEYLYSDASFRGSDKLEEIVVKDEHFANHMSSWKNLAPKKYFKAGGKYYERLVEKHSGEGK